MQTRSLGEDVAVAAQISAADVAALAGQGVRSIINNRPDGEAPDQPTSAELAAAAAAASVAYRHIPVAGPPAPETIAAFGQALTDLPRPTLAFCRSGTRSTMLWAFTAARAGRPVDDILAQARSAGYELAGLRPLLAAEAPR